WRAAWSACRRTLSKSIMSALHLRRWDVDGVRINRAEIVRSEFVSWRHWNPRVPLESFERGSVLDDGQIMLAALLDQPEFGHAPNHQRRVDRVFGIDLAVVV